MFHCVLGLITETSVMSLSGTFLPIKARPSEAITIAFSSKPFLVPSITNKQGVPLKVPVKFAGNILAFKMMSSFD